MAGVLGESKLFLSCTSPSGCALDQSALVLTGDLGELRAPTLLIISTSKGGVYGCDGTFVSLRSSSSFRLV